MPSISTFCPDCHIVTMNSTRCQKCGQANLPISPFEIEPTSRDAHQFRNKTKRAPMNLDSGSPAEILEYHIAVHIDANRLPPYFKLSDNARAQLIEIITSIKSIPWLEDHTVTHAIYSFITGWLVGRDESAVKS